MPFEAIYQNKIISVKDIYRLNIKCDQIKNNLSKYFWVLKIEYQNAAFLVAEVKWKIKKNILVLENRFLTVFNAFFIAKFRPWSILQIFLEIS